MLGFLSDTLSFGNTLLKMQSSFAQTCSEVTGAENYCYSWSVSFCYCLLTWSVSVILFVSLFILKAEIFSTVAQEYLFYWSLTQHWRSQGHLLWSLSLEVFPKTLPIRSERVCFWFLRTLVTVCPTSLPLDPTVRAIYTPHCFPLNGIPEPCLLSVHTKTPV